MATILAEAPLTQSASRRRSEHLFFWSMSVLIALIVFIGFARTYYLAALFHPKPLPGRPPGALVHVHGAVFTCWIALLVAQASLAGSGRIDVHRRLGLLGLGLAPVMVVLGVAVATDMVRRFAGVAIIDSPGIYAVALSEIAGFAVPVFFAFRLRSTPEYHKRLILIGTIAMMTAGFGRWPVHFLLHKPLPAMLAAFSLLLLVGGYDLLSRGKLHRATVLGGAWVIFAELSGDAIGHTAAWHSFAAFVQAA